MSLTSLLPYLVLLALLSSCRPEPQTAARTQAPRAQRPASRPLPDMSLRPIEELTETAAPAGEAARRRIARALAEIGHSFQEARGGESDEGIPFIAALSIYERTDAMLTVWDWEGKACTGSLECRYWGMGPPQLPAGATQKLLVADLLGGPGGEVGLLHNAGTADQLLIVPTGPVGPLLDRVSSSCSGRWLSAGRTGLGAGVIVAHWDELTSDPLPGDTSPWPSELRRFNVLLYLHVWDGNRLRFMGVAPDTAEALRMTKEEFVSETAHSPANPDWTASDAEALYDELWQGRYAVPLFEGLPDRSVDEENGLIYSPGLPGT